MSIDKIRKTLTFNRAEKKFNQLDKEHFQLNKMRRQGIEIPRAQIDAVSTQLGNAAFDVNQADMARGGDGDYTGGYSDTGGSGFKQVVQRQDTLNELAERNEAKAKQDAAIDWSYTQGSHYDRGWSELTDKEKNSWYEKYKNKNN